MYLKEKKAHLIKGEGSVDHMYLDTAGVVTIGVGFALFDVDDALEIDFSWKLKKLKGHVVLNEDVEHEFNTVQDLPKGKVASWYADKTELKISQGEISKLLSTHIHYFEEDLEVDFDGYSKQPKEAQIALLDMAYNLGHSGLMRKFPKFCGAFRARDWEKCALECHRRGISDWRNQETETLFRKLIK